MNHDPGDPTFVLGDADLRALFAARRPDAAAFARGVAARIHARGTDSTPVARAAGHTPLDIVSLAATKGSIWTLPFGLLSLVGGAFLWALHVLRRTLRGHAAREAGAAEAFGERGLLMTGVFLVGTLVVVALSGLGTTWLADALLLLLVTVMLLLVLGVRRHAAGHGIDRAAVATLCTGALEAVLILGMFWLHADSPLAGTAQWQTATLVVLCVGILAMLPVAPRARLGALLTLAIVVVPWLVIPGARALTTADLERAVATHPVSESSWVEAPSLAELVEELRAGDQQIALPPEVDAALRAERDADPANAFVLTAEERMGRISATEWSRLAGRRDHAFALDRLLRGSRPLGPRPFEEYEVAMLCATTPLDDTARDRLAHRLLDGLEGARLPLEAWSVAARWLDRLDRGPLLAARRDEVHALLTRCQHFGAHDPGGFAATLDNPHSNRQATSAAVELIARFGAPRSVDLPALHRQLRRAARLFPSQELHDARYALSACVDLRRLERTLGEPTRSPLRTLLDERTFLAMSALVALCLYAIWASPRPLPATAGAMP